MNIEALNKCTCGQYDEILRRCGMKNPTCCYTKRLKRRKQDTEFIESGHGIRKPRVPLKIIANDKGGLLPEEREKVKKKCNLWGPPGLSVWEEGGFTVPLYRKVKPICLRPYPDIGYEELPSYYKPKGPQKSIDCSQFDTCNNICSTFNLCNIAEEFENLRRLKLPIIWIYGYQQKGICMARKHFLYRLFREMGFTYVNMDQIMFDWGRNYIHTPPAPKSTPGVKTNTCKIAIQAKITKYGPWVGDDDDEFRRQFDFEQNEEEDFFCPGYATADTELIKRKRDALMKASKHVQRCITLMYRLMPDAQEACTPHGLCEFLKCAFLQGYPTKGYVVEGFPTNVHEAEVFEKFFWPAAGGIYFLNKSWTHNKKIEPEVEEPILFRRSINYDEAEVESTCKTYAYKSIKIHYSSCVKKRDLDKLKRSVQSMMKQYPDVLNGTVDTSITKYLAEFLADGERKSSWNRNKPCIMPESDSDSENEEEEEEEEPEIATNENQIEIPLLPFESKPLTDRKRLKHEKKSISSDDETESIYDELLGIQIHPGKDVELSDEDNLIGKNKQKVNRTEASTMTVKEETPKTAKKLEASTETPSPAAKLEASTETPIPAAKLEAATETPSPANKLEASTMTAKQETPTTAAKVEPTSMATKQATPLTGAKQAEAIIAKKEETPIMTPNEETPSMATEEEIVSIGVKEADSEECIMFERFHNTTRQGIPFNRKNPMKVAIIPVTPDKVTSSRSKLAPTIPAKQVESAPIIDPAATESNQIRSILRKGLGGVNQLPVKSVNTIQKSTFHRKNFTSPPPAPPPTARSDTSKATFIGTVVINQTSKH